MLKGLWPTLNSQSSKGAKGVAFLQNTNKNQQTHKITFRGGQYPHKIYFYYNCNFICLSFPRVVYRCSCSSFLSCLCLSLLFIFSHNFIIYLLFSLLLKSQYFLLLMFVKYSVWNFDISLLAK